MIRLQWFVVLNSMALTMCSAWIDDFSVDDGSADGSFDDTETGADGDTDVDGDGDADSDSDGDGPSCGVMIATPKGDEIEFCSTGAGTVRMGCEPGQAPDETCLNTERPAHDVQLSAFIVQRREVTIAQFSAFVSDRPEWAKGGASAREYCAPNYLNDWPDGAPLPGMERRPVLWVCWHAAMAYCQWIGSAFRLPSEAQWEFAARAGYDGQSGRPYWMYPFGNQPSCALANYENCAGQTQDVGVATGASPLGLFDMAGNAWEWTLDWYRGDYYCDPTDSDQFVFPNCNTAHPWQDPVGDATGSQKALRGGSWYHGTDLMRSAHRQGLEPSNTSNLIGLRCAR